MTARPSLREVGAGLREWFLRPQALREARAQIPGDAARAFEQAGLLRAVARQVSEPVEDLPAGRRQAVLLSLYRDLVYWALVAEDASEPGTESNVGTLRTLWDRSSPDRLLRAAGDADALATIRQIVLEPSPKAALDVAESDVARVGRFAETLCGDLEGPQRRVDRILARRWLRQAAVGFVVLVLLFFLRSMAIGPNLAAGGHFHASSTWPDCAADPPCASQLFHTREENGPWVEFDLGATKKVHYIEAHNRVDCCQDRAVPLVVEVSTDHTHWKEVARRDDVFFTWKAKFPPTQAHYLRLRVPKTTVFHLKEVTIR